MVLGGVAGCSSTSTQGQTGVYDFGPGAVGAVPAATPDARVAQLPAIALVAVDTGSALETNAMLYRLAYADAQQLRPYAKARWSMPPAELIFQRVREQLGVRRAVLQPTDGNGPGSSGWSLRLELEEFSQVFESPDKSTGLLRLRATLAHTGASGRTLQQRAFVVQRPSTSADAPGGVRALTAAVDAAIAELDQWVQQVQSAPVP